MDASALVPHTSQLPSAHTQKPCNLTNLSFGLYLLLAGAFSLSTVEFRIHRKKLTLTRHSPRKLDIKFKEIFS
jgi:hypothetical protein